MEVKAWNLRSRPPIIRYAYVAVGEKNIHAGLAYTGLAHAMAHDNILSVHVVDLETGRNYTADPEHFSAWWRANYLNPEANYESERK